VIGGVLKSVPFGHLLHFSKNGYMPTRDISRACVRACGLKVLLITGARTSSQYDYVSSI